MLSAADAALTRRDHDLPGLSRLLDAEAFAAALVPVLGTTHMIGVDPTYVRYKPHTSCLVAYRVRLADREMFVYAKTHAPGAALKIGKSLALGTALDACSVVFLFPADRRLRALRRLYDVGARRRLWRSVLAGVDVSARSDPMMLRYKPERRFVGRLSGHDRNVVVRAYSVEAYARAPRWPRVHDPGGTLRLPRELGRSPERAVVAYEWIDGHSLEALHWSPESLRVAGAALARLHAQPPVAREASASRHGAHRLVSAARWLRVVHPRARALAEPLGRTLVPRLASREAHASLIHGDFHARQVLIAGACGVIVDLDEAGPGDPHLDLGTFVAHLERSAVSNERTASEIEDATRHLLEGYAEAGGRVDGRALALEVAAALLRLAPQPFREREPDWPEKIEALLERARVVAQEALQPAPQAAARQTPPLFEDPLAARHDSALPQVAAALDVAAVERALTALPFFADVKRSVRVISARVVRHRPGRRCVIEYGVHEAPGTSLLTLLGKVRGRGADRRTYTLVSRLRALGFHEGDPDGVAVPPAVGVLEAFGMWLQRHVAGVPASSFFGGADGLSVARRAADAVFKLHRLGPATSRAHGLPDEMRILKERIALVIQRQPALAARLARMLDGCLRLGASCPPVAPCGIHRDFYPDHVLLDGRLTYVIDLDLYCWGDPAVDIGNFMAHVTEQSLRHYGDPGALADVERAFLERYVELVGTRVRHAASIYRVLTLARLIEVATRIPERAQLLSGLLEVCEQLLDLAPRHRLAAGPYRTPGATL